MIHRAVLGAFAAAVACLPALARADSQLFMAMLNGEQSIAMNSTPLATRTGTGMGMVSIDVDTGNVEVMLSFQGLINSDITKGTPGTTPQTRSGNNVEGFGLVVAHFHVGSPTANGAIPVNLIGNNNMDGLNGKAAGIVAQPDPIQSATSGVISGRLNIRTLAAMNMGTLLAGIPLDGRNDNLRNPQCTDCGFIEAILSNNTYLNLHTLNNLSGEIRGQLLRIDMQGPSAESSAVLDGLAAQIEQLETQGGSVVGLTKMLDDARSALEQGRAAEARSNVSALISEMVTQSSRAGATVALAAEAETR
jgi:hypothetical protein